MAPHGGQNRWEGTRSVALRELVPDQGGSLFHYDRAGGEDGCELRGSCRVGGNN